VDLTQYDDLRGEMGGYIGEPGKLEYFCYIPHPGEVDRARISPHNCAAIATLAPKGQEKVLVWDYGNFSNDKDKEKDLKPTAMLGGNTDICYGLSWNPNQVGKILASSKDKTICLWDINNKQLPDVVKPISIFNGHTSAVGDVAWHPLQEDFFGSVGDDKKIMFWDARDSNGPVSSHEGHQAEINGLAFNPFSEFLLATASSDNTVGLWDLRILKERLHSFNGHSGPVFSVQWSPVNGTILGSIADDRRLHVWDLSGINKAQSPQDAEDGPPELLFIHGGHTAKVNDFSWSYHDPWLVASVAEDNVLQVWQMAENIYNEESVQGQM